MLTFKVMMLLLAVGGAAIAAYAVLTSGVSAPPSALLVIGLTLTLIGYLAYLVARFGDPRRAYTLGRRDEARAVRERSRMMRAA